MIELKTFDGVPGSENSIPFHQGMVRRMEVSFFKYGAVADAYPKKIDAIASLLKRLENYKDDGNLEWLIDAANFAMIEFMCPRHKKAHFRATNSDESPGRKFKAGFSQEANTDEETTAHDVLNTYRGREGD